MVFITPFANAQWDIENMSVLIKHQSNNIDNNKKGIRALVWFLIITLATQPVVKFYWRGNLLVSVIPQSINLICTVEGGCKSSSYRLCCYLKLAEQKSPAILLINSTGILGSVGIANTFSQYC